MCSECEDGLAVVDKFIFVILIRGHWKHSEQLLSAFCLFWLLRVGQVFVVYDYFSFFAFFNVNDYFLLLFVLGFFFFLRTHITAVEGFH